MLRERQARGEQRRAPDEDGRVVALAGAVERQRRFERAEKLANEAPVKLLGPLVLFIFPSVFLVLLGPILFRVAGQA